MKKNLIITFLFLFLFSCSSDKEIENIDNNSKSLENISSEKKSNDLTSSWSLEKKEEIIVIPPRFDLVEISWNELYFDTETSYYWDFSESNKFFTWSLKKLFDAPIWDWKKYTFSEWRKISDYPAFEYCLEKGEWWKLPSKSELENIIWSRKNKSWFNTDLESVVSSEYWTSDISWSWKRVWVSKFIRDRMSVDDKTDLNKVLCINNLDLKSLSSNTSTWEIKDKKTSKVENTEFATWETLSWSSVYIGTLSE